MPNVFDDEWKYGRIFRNSLYIRFKRYSLLVYCFLSYLSQVTCPNAEVFTSLLGDHETLKARVSKVYEATLANDRNTISHHERRRKVS